LPQLTGEGHGRQEIKGEFAVGFRVLDGLVLLLGLDRLVVGVVVLERPVKVIKRFYLCSGRSLECR